MLGILVVSALCGSKNYNQQPEPSTTEQTVVDSIDFSQPVAKVYQCIMKCEGEKTYEAIGKCPECDMDFKNGSKVAQEAASMILLDDNFSTIVVAIKEGRTIFRNLEKTIKTNLSSNIAELTCVLFGFVGAFMGIATPILAVQILLIDMIGEMLPLIMLTYDPPEKSIVEIPPRNPKDKILTMESMKGILFNGSVMGIAAYGAFLVEYFHNHHLSNRYEKAITVTFISIIFGQYANLLSRRTFGRAFGKYLFSNPYLLWAFAISISGILLIVYIPALNYYCHTSPLLAFDWLFPMAAGSTCLAIFELKKICKIKSYDTYL